MRKRSRSTAGERKIERRTDQASTVSAATTATAIASRATEVSMRQPSQLIATSPGRSASQAAPSAITAMATRKMTTRIMAAAASTGRLRERHQRIGRKSTAGCYGSHPCLRLGGPALCGRPHGWGEIAELGEGTRHVAAHGFDLDPRDYGGRIVAGNFLDRPDAHQPLRIGLQLVQESAFGRHPGGLQPTRLHARGLTPHTHHT